MRPATDSATTVPALLRRRAEEMPTALAFSARSWRGGRDRLTYRQLALRMDMVAAGLSGLDLSHGDRVAVFLDNDAGREAVLTALGAMALGAVIAPLNTRASDRELTHALGLVEPVLIVTRADHRARLAGLAPSGRLVILDADADADADSADVWPEPDRLPPPAVGSELPDPDDLACLLFTSGTTGASKAVMHSHRTMLAAGRAVSASVGLEPGDLYQGAFPFFTSSCLNIGCMSAWVARAGFVMEGPLDNAERLRLIATEGTTVYHGVPAVLQFLADQAATDPCRPSALRRFGYGGAAMPVTLIEQIAERFPGTDQVHIWGMTETGPAGTVLAPDHLPGKAGAIGVAMQGCQIRLVDEAGMDVPDGKPGEMLFAGPSAALGYFRNPEETSKTFVDGWVRTGDIAIRDADGILHFHDHKKDVINRGGLKISSVAVEQVILRFDGIAEAAVAPLPHPKLGEDIAAFIVEKTGADVDPDALTAFCATRLADYEVPRRIVKLDALPRNPMGKVQKHLLSAATPRT